MAGLGWLALAVVSAVPGGPLELVAAYEHGDPAALCVSDDGKRVFSAEGGVIARLRWDGRVLALDPRRPYATVGAWASELAWTPEGLWIAGGTQGLLALAPDAERARSVDDPEGVACTGVAAGERDVCALFAARDASELFVYARPEGRPLGRCALGPGTAYALERAGEQAYVAMGSGGLVRVDLSDPSAPALDGALPAGALREGSGAEEGVLARDLAVAGEFLWVAAGAGGLLRIDLRQGFGLLSAVERHSLPADARGYAVRVSARGGRVAVGLDAQPVEVSDGAPHNALGWMGPRMEPGGVARELARRGTGERLFVLAPDPAAAGAAWRVESEARRTGPWRDLVLGRRFVFEQHAGEGLVVRPLDSSRPRVVGQRIPPGFAATDGIFSQARPGRLYFGTDPDGSVPPQALELDARGDLEPARLDARATPPPVGRLPGALWRADSGAEWLAAPAGSRWRLFRLGPRRARWWDLAPPETEPRAPTGPCAGGCADRELILLARHGTRAGLVAYARADLQAAAREEDSGGAVSPPPAFVVDTHQPHEQGPWSSWRVAPLAATDGRRLALVAAGFNSNPELRANGHARLVVVDVGLALEGSPRAVVAAAHGPRPEGQYVSVAAARVGGRDLAFAADLAGGLDVFDLGPAVPERIGGWSCPVNAFDGRRDNVLDVAVDKDASGRARVFLACARAGVVVLDASAPDTPELPLLQRIDTPGLAWGLALGQVRDRRLLAVGDRLAGLRLYDRDR